MWKDFNTAGARRPDCWNRRGRAVARAGTANTAIFSALNGLLLTKIGSDPTRRRAVGRRNDDDEPSATVCATALRRAERATVLVSDVPAVAPTIARAVCPGAANRGIVVDGRAGDPRLPRPATTIRYSASARGSDTICPTTIGRRRRRSRSSARAAGTRASAPIRTRSANHPRQQRARDDRRRPAARVHRCSSQWRNRPTSAAGHAAAATRRRRRRGPAVRRHAGGGR